MAHTDLKAFEKRYQEVKKEIAADASRDSAFRSELVSNPSRTIEKKYGLPEGSLRQIKFRVLEEGPKKIVLPIPASSGNQELSDEQLEAVAGGAAFFCAVGGVVLGTLAGAVVVAGIDQGVRRGW